MTHIIENNIVHWDDVNPTSLIKEKAIFTCIQCFARSSENLVNLYYFADWVVGFTIAEGSFGVKEKGSAFYQIKQKGTENYEVIKAICLIITCIGSTAREAYPIKADSVNAYQLTLSSKADVQKVVSFFSSSNNYPLLGYKLKGYDFWLIALKGSNRYKDIKHPN